MTEAARKYQDFG